MSENFINSLNRSLQHRLYSFAVSNPEEAVSVFDETLNYGVEKLSKENPLLMVKFLLKFCTIDKDDVGIALNPIIGGGREIIISMEDIVHRLLDVLTSICNTFLKDIPNDVNIRLNLKSSGDTVFYSSFSDKSDLIFNDDGFKAHLIVEDGKISVGLGLLDNAEEVTGPTNWLKNLFIGAVDASEIKNEKVKEYLKYISPLILKMVPLVIKDPKDLVLSDAWLSDVEKRWNSDDEKINSLKDDISILVRIREIPSNLFPNINSIIEVLKGKLSEKEIARIKDFFKKGADIFLSSNNGRITLKLLSTDEKIPSADINVDFLYEGLVKFAYGEMSLLGLFKEPLIFITTPMKSGRGAMVFKNLIGFDLLIKELIRNILLPVPIIKR